MTLRGVIVSYAVFLGLLIGAYVASGWEAMLVAGGAGFLFAIGVCIGIGIGDREATKVWAEAERYDALSADPRIREMRRGAAWN